MLPLGNQHWNRAKSLKQHALLRLTGLCQSQTQDQEPDCKICLSLSWVTQKDRHSSMSAALLVTLVSAYLKCMHADCVSLIITHIEGDDTQDLTTPNAHRTHFVKTDEGWVFSLVPLVNTSWLLVKLSTHSHHRLHFLPPVNTHFYMKHSGFDSIFPSVFSICTHVQRLTYSSLLLHFL